MVERLAALVAGAGGVLLAVAAVLVAIVLIAIPWRVFGWPCPPWLTFLLENPYVGAVMGSEKLLDRAGVEPGMRILDVGSGPGRLAIPAAERVGNSGSVVALDVQASMLRRLEERARRRGIRNIEILHAGAGEGRVERESFDRAFLVTVLGEIDDQAAALEEIRSALKPGGLLLVGELIPDPHYQSRSKVQRLGTEAGFDVDAAVGGWMAFTRVLRK